MMMSSIQSGSKRKENIASEIKLKFSDQMK